MGDSCRLFGLLLWKNFKLQQRKKIVTLLEIVFPVLFALILILIREKVKAHDMKDGLRYSSFHTSKFPTSLCPSKPICIWPLSDLPWWLYYSPQNDFTRDVMKIVVKDTDRIDNVVGFSNETALIKDLEKCLNKMHFNISTSQDYKISKSHIENSCIVLGGIVFEDMPKQNETSQHISYKIRLRYSWSGEDFGNLNDMMTEARNMWHTGLMFPTFQTPGPRTNDSKYGGPPKYYQEGFLTLQEQVDRAIIQVTKAHFPPTTNSTDLRASGNFPLYLKRFPYPPWRDDQFVIVIQKQLPLLLMLSFVFFALQIVKDVVHEKERKLKETLKMMGISNWLHWSAWFAKYVIYLLITVVLMTLLFCLPISRYGSVVGHTHPTVVALFLFVYSISTICFAFLVSVFFSKANPAAAAAGVLFFVSYIPYFFLQPRYDQLSWAAKIGSCLISNVAMAYGGQVIGMFEGTGGGIQWSNIAQGASIDDQFSMLHVIGMLLLDSCIYFIIAWYIEAVFPGEYGVPKPWYFPFTRTYWCGSTPQYSECDECTPLLADQDASYFEDEPEGLVTGIRTDGLRKVYRRGRPAAVKGLSLNMYQGQITALLGHNGAGKTTTISMLTGFLPPTSGTAVVTGYDIRHDIDSVRKNLGLCPQHDVLFDSLTVMEHLYFFARMKNVATKKLASELENSLQSVNLAHKRNAQSKTLSGGQKRKLSVGIALIGGSKVVILDEPTSGLDPNARRQIWDILNNHKRGRTVILTTHYMDEADVLGDRIAIMAHGNLKCCGSPLFLKNKYGAGYNLVIVKSSKCDVEHLTSRIQGHIQTAQLQSAISAELSYMLPYHTKNHFEQLFVDLEENMSDLGINSFGVSVTTMEEVFIRVGELSDSVSGEKYSSDDDTSVPGSVPEAAPGSVPGSVQESAYGSTSSTPVSGTVMNPSQYDPSLNMRLLACNEPVPDEVRKYTGLHFYFSQLQALFIKRVLHTSRNLTLTISQILVPVVFTILALVVLKTMPGPTDAPPLTLDMSHFGANTIVFNTTNQHDATEELGQLYERQFMSLRHINVRNTSDKTLEKYVVDIGKKSLPSYNEDLNIGASFSRRGTTGLRANLFAYFNNQAYHNTAISLAAIMNALFAYVMDSDDVSIETINHPLPRSQGQEVDNDIMKSIEGFTISFNLLFGMAFLISSFAMFLIKERTTKAKHVQFVSGVHAITFWLSTFLWDFINFIIPCLLLLVVFACFQVEAYCGDGRLGYIMLMFVMYGWAGLPFTYLASFIFTVPSSGLVWLTMFNIISGIGTVLAVDILSIPQLDLQHVSMILEWIFLTCMPNFCLGQGLEDVYQNYQFIQICSAPYIQAGCQFNITTPCCKDNCGDFCLFYTDNYLSWEKGGIGRYLVFLAVQGFIFFTILLVIETEVPKKLWYMICGARKIVIVDPGLDGLPLTEDSDVALERQRIAATESHVLHSLDSVVLCDVSKYYTQGNIVAVDRLSLGIPRQECFGLLGVNGAGKTSTFKMLTGDELVTAGDAFVSGFSVKKDINQVQCMLGYCPQYDALIDELTGRETLVMFARLRGVRNINTVVDNLIKDLLLTEHAHKLVKAYSGGNKRKLSSAIALVGGPPIILLDEPSSGMDPVARRQLWSVLDKARSSGRTLVLTSHSMEECEALCTRVAIMVNGRLKCLGSTQHLKSKFGEGYTLMVKLPAANIESFMDMITTTFPASVLKDAHHGMLHYHITDPTIKWSQLFCVMEKSKDKFQLDDYSLSQTTLEQVFITFAQAQNPPVEMTPSCCDRLTSCLPWAR